MSTSGPCVRLFGRVGTALRSLRDSFARRLPLRRPPTISKYELFDVLSSAELNEREFLSAILFPLDDSVFSRLLDLEGFLDEGYFWEAAAGINREEVDRQVSYEFQNVRAYVYYLTLKARLRSYQASFRFEELVDRSSFAFNPETIIFHVRESSRLMTQLAHFLPYSQASVRFDLTKSILRLRILAFFELEFDCFVLLLFMLVHNEPFRSETRSKDIISALKYFGRSLETWNEASKSAKLSFEEKNPPKTLADNLLGRVTSLFEHIFFFKKTDSKEMQTVLRGAKECAGVLLGKPDDAKEPSESRDYTIDIREKRADFIGELRKIAEEKIRLVKAGDVITETAQESNFRGLVRRVIQRNTVGVVARASEGEARLSQPGLPSLLSSLHLTGGSKLKEFMQQPSIILGPKKE